MKVYGYIYDNHGMHDGKHAFEGTLENIASFIMNNNDNPVVITDDLDNLIVSSTAGGFLDRFGGNYAHLRGDLLEVLLPMQIGDIQPSPVEIDDYTFY